MIYCDECAELKKQSPLKPGVVFFGEPMPKKFKNESTKKALSKVDLMVIIGTTLKVKPFGYLPMGIPKHVPQVLINRELTDVSGGK